MVLQQNKSLIGVVASIAAIVALLTSVLTLYTQVQTVAQQIASNATKELKKDFAPVGTIISSTLTPEEFAKSISEDLGGDYRERKWVLADGREVLGTQYAILTNNRPLPDLRGVFLRGLDPKSTRKVGSLENSATALPRKGFTGITSTSNEITLRQAGTITESERFNVGGRDYSIHNPPSDFTIPATSFTVTINGGGDTETRPKNVAVFYYIKIN